MSCPLCGGRAIGKIGVEQFYCWDCCVEYDSSQHVFEIAEDGSLQAVSGSQEQDSVLP